MNVNSTRKTEGWKAFAYPRHGSAHFKSPFPCSLIFRSNDNSKQATLLLVASIPTAQGTQHFALQYDADKLLSGTEGLAAGNTDIPQIQLDELARNKGDRHSDFKTLTLRLERPCPLWCPSAWSFESESTRESSLLQLVELAKATTIHIVFDYKYVLPQHRPMFRLFCKVAPNVVAYPTRNLLAERGLRKASCEDFSPVDDIGPPPAYDDSRKRPRQANPNSPHRSPKRPVTSLPAKLNLSNDTEPLSPETTAALERDHFERLPVPEKQPRPVWALSDDVVSPSQDLLGYQPPPRLYSSDDTATSSPDLAPAWNLDYLKPPPRPLPVCYTSDGEPASQDSLDCQPRPKLSSPEGTVVLSLDSAAALEKADLRPQPVLGNEPQPVLDIQAAITAAVNEQLPVHLENVFPGVLRSILLNAPKSKFAKRPALTSLAKGLIPHLRVHLAPQLKRYHTRHMKRVKEFADRSRDTFADDADDARRTVIGEIDDEKEDFKAEIISLREDSLSAVVNECDRAAQTAAEKVDEAVQTATDNVDLVAQTAVGRVDEAVQTATEKLEVAVQTAAEKLEAVVQIAAEKLEAVLQTAVEKADGALTMACGRVGGMTRLHVRKIAVKELGKQKRRRPYGRKRPLGRRRSIVEETEDEEVSIQTIDLPGSATTS